LVRLRVTGGMSIRLRLPAALVTTAILLSACSTTGSGTARPADTAPTPAPTATPAGLAHPTGANEIILRADEAGGFVPVEWMAAHVPYFTLYGDGRVVFVSSSTVVEPSPDGVMTGSPLRATTLSEAQIQDLLMFALADGGLAAARADYQNPFVADAPSTIFEVHADGDSKTVTIVALGMEGEPDADTAIKAAFMKLAELLRDFDKGGSLGSAPYEPTAYRGVLNDASGAQGVKVREWPWPDLAPADFALPADPNTLQVQTRVLTPAEAAAVGVDGFEGGIVGGAFLRAPDGKLYSLALRPLLPDEEA
jgi:hypothetical protein